MNHLKLIVLGLCVASIVFLLASCSAMPACTSVVRLKLEVCPTK
jgi:hypothetical protein